MSDRTLTVQVVVGEQGILEERVQGGGVGVQKQGRVLVEGQTQLQNSLQLSRSQVFPVGEL